MPPRDFSFASPFRASKDAPLIDKRHLAKDVMGPIGKALMEELDGHETVPEREEQVNEVSLLEHERTKEAASFEGEALENYLLLQEARDLLGEQNVHGVKDVEFALGYQIDRVRVPPIPYTREDFLKSKEIKEKTGVEEMLILCVADRDGRSLTIQKMGEVFNQRYEEMAALGKFLPDDAWYRNEPFYKDLGLAFRWRLITKQCIPDSVDRRHDWKEGDEWSRAESQEMSIQLYAHDMNLPSTSLHRPEPREMLYAMAVHFLSTEKRGRGKGERLLPNHAHWSGVRDLDGNFVIIGGGADRSGAYVGGYPRDDWHNYLGVCLSR